MCAVCLTGRTLLAVAAATRAAVCYCEARVLTRGACRSIVDVAGSQVGGRHPFGHAAAQVDVVDGAAACVAARQPLLGVLV